ncbi:DNA-3-methyladenine glycosylase I [Flavobacterium weaverense]|uniref:DNA-3-methyladenine glycosylase I n=1 Tax=Flavobacterium weaverense TaxID=271156 RepID=A0A3M0A5Q1_9FLAO|nr:DNA-3-methyladenine glycosylase I [Flavobacterium weaverense]RMA77795.1 DNA-3-methyladenine glycosylase I [Flavobacterium weaverense]
MEDKVRCAWCEKDDLYRKYHDQEWGKPVHDDATFFEFIILETFQAGLNWHTILKKRENFRLAFDHFNYKKIAIYNEDKFQELLQDTGIIRNKLKIRSAISNAHSFIKVQEEFGSFSNYIWYFTSNKSVINRPKSLIDVPSTTPLSDKISKDLKKRGFKFVGSTVVYAFLQATGIVNDHLENCWIKD